MNPEPDLPKSSSATEEAEERRSHARNETRSPRIDAFSTFYRGDFPRLVTFLMCLGATESEARQLAQDSMIAAYNNWQSLDRPSLWIRRISSQALLRLLADVDYSRLRQPSVTGRDRKMSADDCSERHKILRLVSLLPHRQRQLLAWSFDGFTPQDVAEELNVPIAIVEESLRAARAYLATQLADELQMGRHRG